MAHGKVGLHLEHEDAVGGFAPGVVLFGIQALKDGAKYLPVDDGVESLQWIARFAQAGVAVLKAKETVLHATPVCLETASITFQGGLTSTGIERNL